MSETDAGGDTSSAGDAAGDAPADDAVATSSAGGTGAGGGAAPETSQPDVPLSRRVRRGLLGVVAVMGIYYAAPVGRSPSNVDIVVSVLGLLVGMLILIWLVYRQVRRVMHSPPGDTSVRLEGLVLVVYVVVPMFALGYFSIEDAAPSQFDGMATKTDALYFTLSTLATVGFGDVHAAGQLARVLVSLQMLFDLVVVALVASILSTRLRERAGQRRGDRTV
jgi:voltage-gated potassium channel